MPTHAPIRLDGDNEFERLRLLLGMQRRVLGLVATGAPATAVFDALCREVEALVPGAVCTVMTLEGTTLRMVSAPSAPEGIRKGADGIQVGEGSCGAAAATGQPVIVGDTSTDERWRPYRHVAEALGITACWSIPIVSRRAPVGIRGTFALYFFSGVVTPDGVQSQILESASSMAAIAIERADAERSLARAETTYRAVFESVHDAIFIHDLESGDIVDVNPRMCEMYGYTREEALRLRIGDISAGGDCSDSEAQRLIGLAASGSPQIFEWHARHRDGSDVWVEVNLKRATIDGVDRVLAVVRDISGRKVAEGALRESEATMRSVLESSPDFVLLLDPACTIRFMNRTMPEHTTESVIGKSIFDYIDESQWARVRECFARVRATREPDQYEVEYRSPERGPIIFESRVAPVIHDGVLAGFTVSATDATARRRAERAIAESEDRFRQLAEAIDDVFWLTDWVGRRVIYVSPSYERVWGRSPDRVSEDPADWLAVVHPDDRGRVEREWDELAPQGRYDTEYRIVRSDGETRWIRDKAFPIRGESGRVVRIAGVSEDVTERKLAEEEIIRRIESERILRSELDHRVRNNLASLITLIEMSEESAEDMASFASAIKGRVNAMATIHSFLSRTRWRDVHLHEMVEALTPPDARAAVVCEGDPVMVPAYQCNSLAVVLHELMHNSLKYGAMGTGGSIALTWETAPVEGEQGAVRLSLRWRETGGAPIEGQPRPGVGSALIDGLVKWDLGGDVRFHYAPDGPDHTIGVVLRPE